MNSVLDSSNAEWDWWNFSFSNSQQKSMCYQVRQLESYENSLKHVAVQTILHTDTDFINSEVSKVFLTFCQ